MLEIIAFHSKSLESISHYRRNYQLYCLHSIPSTAAYQMTYKRDPTLTSLSMQVL